MGEEAVNIWLMMLIAGIVTYATRLSFILLVGQRQVPPLARRALRFVPPAVLTAIIVPEIMLQNGQLAITPGNARLLAGLLAILVAWRTRNALLTIVVGMLALWAIQWALAAF
jgi:branched-subunit amino acid transport protein